MKYQLSILSAGILFTGLSGNAHAVQLLLEDFENSTVDYTLTQGLDGIDGAAVETSDGALDYFGRIGGTGGLTITETYNNASGGFFAIQDMDASVSSAGDPNISSSIAYMSWSGLDISTHTSFSFSILLAENRPGGNLDWDADISFQVEYRIDGGIYQDLLAVEQVNAVINDQEAAIDTNFDGIGDGTIISDSFAQHTATFTGTGNTLDLRITMLNFDTSGEDIGFDNVSLTTVVPEPSSAILAAFGLIPLITRRKR